MVRTAGTHIAINPKPKYSMVTPDTRAAPDFSRILLMSISYLPGWNTGLVWCSRCARNIARTMSVQEIQNFAGVKPGIARQWAQWSHDKNQELTHGRRVGSFEPHTRALR
jgi:hypothetical protein